MAGVTLGYLRYVLGLDTIAFTKGMSDADRQLVLMQKKFLARGKEFTKVGKELSLAVTAPLAGFAAFGVKKALEMAQSMAQVNAALKSTGGVAGVTAGQLKKAAEALESKSLFESEDILKSVSARLLAFGNIHGAVFLRAQQVIADYAQRSGKDLGAATVVIGKAIEAPAKYFGQLARAGVVLSQSQQQLIKGLVASGNVVGAQSVLLGILETKYKGAADAAANADPFRKTTVAFKQMAETIGTALLPLIPPFTQAITAMIGWFEKLSPATQKWLIIAGGIAAVIGPLLVVLGSLTTLIAGLAPLVVALSTPWGLLAGALRLVLPVLGLVGDALLTLLANPILLAGALVIVGIYEAWKHWDQIAPIVKRLYEAVKSFVVDKIFPVLEKFAPLFGPIGIAVELVYQTFKHWDEISAIAERVYTSIKTWFQDKLGAILDFVKTKVDTVTGAFHTMWDKVVGHSYVPDMVQGIADEFKRLQQVMVDPTVSATDKVVAAFQSAGNIIGKIFGSKAGGIFSAIASAVGSLAPLFGTGIKAPDLTSLQPVGISTANTAITPRALGGPVVPGKMYRVGENGPEFVSFGSAGYVHPNRAANDSRSLHFDLRGAVMTADLLAQMNQIGDVATGRGAVLGGAGAQAQLARRARQRIP